MGDRFSQRLFVTDRIQRRITRRFLIPVLGRILLARRGWRLLITFLWFTNQECVYCCSLVTRDFEPQLFLRLDDDIDGIAVWESTIYLTSHKNKAKFWSTIATKQRKLLISMHLVLALENITVKSEEIWLTDTLEQTVYCLDRATGETIFSVLTPFVSPTGLAFNTSGADQETLYVAYADREVYIRDNPNAEPNYELQYRDRTFIHPLYFHYNKEKDYALSNGYLVEMSYTEEISPLDPITIDNLEWRIALPAETDRQKIREVRAIGLPFTEEVKDGQRIAVFKFDSFDAEKRYVFWLASSSRSLEYKNTS